MENKNLSQTEQMFGENWRNHHEQNVKFSLV
jgi:hypothetical protein